TVDDSLKLQLDVDTFAARRFTAVLQRYRSVWTGRVAQMAPRLAVWNCELSAGSVEASLYAMWVNHLYALVFPNGARPPLEVLLRALESGIDRRRELADAAEQAWRDLEKRFGPDALTWSWGRLHTLTFRHPLDAQAWSRGPLPRPGDATTPNATGGSQFRQMNGASYRQIINLADWDRSIVTNAPGESGNPASPHYSDLLEPWAAGRYHPLPYSRRAVLAALSNTIVLRPARR
ncbi:MAG: penicillin acylase family protein, partial [Acidobacteria bacterium]|nr:penicillin acylase family protein [Acidobacteriota bacterium]